MARKKRIRLSQEELKRLRALKAREELEELPYGAYLMQVLGDREKRLTLTGE